MIRTFLLFVLLVGAVAVAFALAGEPGRASVEWLGWRADTTAAAGVCAILVLAFFAVTLWRLGLWLAEAPRRAARRKAEARRRQGADALTRGFLAAAAADGSEARRLAQVASDLVEETPALVRLLAAQAAEIAGDRPAAKAAYNAMLGFPEMRLAAHRGLMQTALAQGDRADALAHAKAAYAEAKTGRWAWRALIEDRLENGDWPAALELVQSALTRKIVSPISAERARTALLAASAAGLETDPDPRRRSEAEGFALQSAKLNPGFAPGVVLAARILAASGKTGRAALLIEQAWKLAPHPALALAWRDLNGGETPKARAARFEALAQLNPEHRESRLLRAERALLLHEPAEAAAFAAPLAEAQPSARVCGLMARIAFAAGQADEARAWMARGAAAPAEADWSDLDPQGRAFAYTPTDWARLVSAFSETGELIHPRLERRERMLSELPELPPAYEPATPLLAPEDYLALDAGDAGLFDDGGPDLEPLPPEPPRPRPPAKPAPRRRLASSPRTAK
ncbi:heme biosynthesis HemY N-terminal domain-containing protein [Phenylobacterium montanum]|uniref:Heme biosynthesis protein HemY n=1 Tax=Phenylobacterium montanum TaxID=2823693 RepID=A0A975ITP6_9CAUL|nr:heme biosynthesis HemY N-terminal domain-containing protein [Caulobacter sp. S6]QUD86988.1 heme biosynthesis protein HemY [Caulobacter sp. S6]